MDNLLPTFFRDNASDRTGANPFTRECYPTQSFTVDPDGPVDVAFRPDGLLTVVNQSIYGGPGVNVATDASPVSPIVGTGSMAPIYQLAGANTGFGYPAAVAFDKIGNMYVTGNALSGGGATVRQFPMDATGNVAPTRTIGLFTYSYGVAVGP
jgi:hypothetical protein